MLDVFIDADGCPVKDEVYRVARRHGLKVWVVANTGMRIPNEEGIELVVVDGGFDAADDWIVAHAGEKDIVITADIPLASRVLGAGARALGPKGGEFTDDGIGNALAGRELMSTLRDMGMKTGGPAPFSKRDRSRFLQRLETIVQALRRKTSSN